MGVKQGFEQGLYGQAHAHNGPALIGSVHDFTGLALALADPTVPRVAHMDSVWDLTGPANWDSTFRLMGYECLSLGISNIHSALM